MRHIETHLSDPALNPCTIAAALHMSRRTLYKVLTPESADGTGVAAVIRRERLVRARRILVDPACGDRTIGQISAEVGIASAARFSRLFRAEFGVAPRDLRTRERFTHRAIDDPCTIPARFDVPCPSSPTSV
jgi:AraC-like DNA-binding protein